MQKINLVIADSDTRYLDLLVSYIRTSDYAGRFTVKTFSNRDNFHLFLSLPTGMDLFLVSLDMLKELGDNALKNATILLTEDNTANSHEFHSVYKYQPLNQLLTQALAFYLERDEQGYQKVRGNRKTTVVSVYSAQGGIGKTTTAANLAVQLAGQGKKVFYLNLEYLNYTPFSSQEGQTGSYSKVLYYLKANPRQLMSQFESLKQHEPNYRVDYFEPVEVSQEMLHMTREDAEMLVDVVVEKAFYDFLIIDLDSSVHERVIGAMEKSDLVLWLVIDDAQCLQKTRMLLSEFKHFSVINNARLMAQTRFIVNRQLSPQNQLDSQHGIAASGYLPYVPEWKTVNRAEQLFSSSFFRQEVGKIMLRLNNWQEEGGDV